MQPRAPLEAAHVVFTLTVVASVVTIIGAVVAADVSERTGSVAATATALGLLIGASWMLRYGHHRLRWPWTVFPFIGLAAVVALDLLTRDASTAAQVFLFFPVLYAASQVHRVGAFAVTIAAVVGDVVIVFTGLAVRDAVIDTVYMAAALGTGSVLLVVAAERREVVMGQLRRRAAIDPLTGLVTRRVLESATQAALTGATNLAGTALILLDIDRFKSVNDGHGHLAGDEVLVQMAGILLNLSRPEDTVSRIGGDEIALLLPACSEAVALERAESIRSTTAHHRFTIADGSVLRISVSLGVAHALAHDFNLRSLYAQADVALYEAKRNGRDRVIALPLTSTLTTWPPPDR
jgi:diguanylate cyclase (GGDEF)-like protein